jgi:hypothetical protein
MISDEASKAIETLCEDFLKIHPNWIREGRVIYSADRDWHVSLHPIDKIVDGKVDYYLFLRATFDYSKSIRFLTYADSDGSSPSLEDVYKTLKEEVRLTIMCLRYDLDLAD